MLVLSRRQGESIVIDGVIRVTIIEIRGGRARVGIEAPAHVPVHRHEVWVQLAQVGRTEIRSRQPSGPYKAEAA